MLEAICTSIGVQLDEVEKIIEHHAISSTPLAAEVARHSMDGGGKRIRPAVFLLSAALGGFRKPNLPSLAAAMELIHTASLLHDDVVDEAQVRRGRPSVRAKWGDKVAVVVGDLLWCCASSILLEGAPQRMNVIISKAITETTEGELLEIIAMESGKLDRETYLRIIGGKTAALFAACGQSGAVVAQMSRDAEEALRLYGYHVGMAFQLIDDLLDEEHDGIVDVKDLARDYAHKAKESLAIFASSPERDALMSLVDFVVTRKK